MICFDLPTSVVICTDLPCVAFWLLLFALIYFLVVVVRVGVLLSAFRLLRPVLIWCGLLSVCCEIGIFLVTVPSGESSDICNLGGRGFCVADDLLHGITTLQNRFIYIETMLDNVGSITYLASYHRFARS